MELFFSPLACSMATRIVLYEAGADATFTLVPSSKRLADGRDYRTINPLGLVPTLRLDDGTLLTENAAILQYVAARHAEANLAPTDVLGRAQLQSWLSFISSELHLTLFTPLLDPSADEGARGYALKKGEARLGVVDRHLTDREFLLDTFSVADAYLATILNWTAAVPVPLKQWPALSAYLGRLRERPSVARALAEELPLFQAERQGAKKT